ARRDRIRTRNGSYLGLFFAPFGRPPLFRGLATTGSAGVADLRTWPGLAPPRRSPFLLPATAALQIPHARDLMGQHAIGYFKSLISHARDVDTRTVQTSHQRLH